MTIQKQVLALFRQLQAQHGFACSFVSHNLAAVANRIVVVHQGRIVDAGQRSLRLGKMRGCRREAGA